MSKRKLVPEPTARPSAKQDGRGATKTKRNRNPKDPPLPFDAPVADGQRKRFTILASRKEPVNGPLSAGRDDVARIHLVPFHTRHREVLSQYNSNFSLRFYLPRHRLRLGRRLDRLFIFLNGFAEATTEFWDAIGESFARTGVASVLLPLPNHFCRNIFFNMNDFDQDDSYHLSEGADVTLREFTTIMKREMIERADQVIEFDQQAIDDVQKLVDCLDNRDGEWEIRNFLRRHFSRSVHISLMGYSLGGLCGLQAYLTQPERYSSCVLVNSGASFQDMDASSMFGHGEWREVQKSLLRAARDRPELTNFFSHVILGHNRVELREHLASNCHKILVLVGGRDRIINFKNMVNVEPSETGLAIFQIPGLEHFINLRQVSGREWHVWSEFAVQMILAFDRHHPRDPSLPPRLERVRPLEV